MKRFAALCAILATCSCVDRTDRDLNRSHDDVQAALRDGDLEKAQQIIDRVLSEPKVDKNSERTWTFRFFRAETLLARADLPAASAILAAELPPSPDFDALRVRRRYLLAKTLVQRGALKDALALLETNPDRAAAGPGLRLDMEVLGGQIRLRLGQWGDAEARLQAVVAEAERTKDRHRQALALNNLGMSRLVRSRYDEALAWFDRVLAFTELERSAVYGAALNNAGICHSRLGAFENARATQERAVAIHRRQGRSVELQEALGSLGNTYFLSGDAKGSIPHLQQALSIATKLNLRPEAGRWARNLAGAYARLEAWDEAERFNNEARRLEDSETGGTQPHFELHAADIAVGRGEFDKAAVLFERARTSPDATPAVRWNAHFGLAGVALAAKQPERAARHFEAALEIIETTRSSLLKTEFKLSFLAQLIDFYHAYVDALIDQGQVDRALEIAESSRGRVLAERQGVQVGATSSAIAFRRVARQSGVVLLSYWLAPTRSHVWVVSAGGIRVMALPPAADIEKLVRDHQAMLGNTLADPLTTNNPPGSRLYELLIAPVSKWIPPGSQVVVVPDGALHRLNFETLPVDGVRPHYWIEDVEIQVAPSLTMLSREPEPAVVNRSLLLIGDPLPRAPEFPALRYASDEMNSIERHFGAAHVDTYRGARAAPAAFRDATPGRFGVIHFTAHALANPDSPLDSAVILSGPDHAFKLYARDVADQKLNADLVTVSACRSAGERSYSGEGLVGFAWAFLRAGSRRVIAGLWDVDDRSTAELMSAVYASIAKGVPAPRALREAKLAFLRNQRTYAKPYYWGAFQVFTVIL
jgi:CHAT domain-containing protein/tetratricopeptide (TPR) repeat protein